MEPAEKKLTLSHLIPALVAIVIDSFGFGLAYPVLAALLSSPTALFLAAGTSHAMRAFYLGLGFFLYPFCMLFGASFMGDLSDKWGRKRVLEICMLGIAVGFFLLGLGVLIKNIAILLIGRGISGLFAGSQPIAQASIADSSPQKDKARNMAYITMTLCVGIVIGPLIGGVLSDSTLLPFFTYETPFFFAALLAVAAYLWIMIAFRETYNLLPSKSVLRWLRPIAIFYEAAKSRPIRWISSVFVLMQTGFGIYYTLILVYLRDVYKYDTSLLGIFTAFLGISFVLGILVVAPRLMHNYPIERIAFVGLLGTGVCIILFPAFKREFLLWIFAFFAGAFDVIAYTAILTIFSNAVSKKHQGWSMGVATAVIAISFAIAGLTTNLISLIGTVSIITIGGLLILISALLMWLAPRFSNLRHPDSHEENQ